MYVRSNSFVIWVTCSPTFRARFTVLHLPHESFILHLSSSFSWSSVAPSLSECNLALGGSCKLNCDPLMTLQLYPSAYTYPKLKMLVIVKGRKNSHVSHGILRLFHKLKATAPQFFLIAWLQMKSPGKNEMPIVTHQC